jgi:hypothetical protein
MAGFEVTLYGRFWVTPEVQRVRKTLDERVGDLAPFHDRVASREHLDR